MLHRDDVSIHVCLHLLIYSSSHFKFLENQFCLVWPHFGFINSKYMRYIILFYVHLNKVFSLCSYLCNSTSFMSILAYTNIVTFPTYMYVVRKLNRPSLCYRSSQKAGKVNSLRVCQNCAHLFRNPQI